MADRVEMARKFVREQLQKRGDIIGAFVGGSVARGEETEHSDIDLALIVEGGEGKGYGRGGTDTWQDGVYVEAGFVPKERYDDLEKVLLNPITATHMNDALILYDPSGFLTRMQQEVRAVFMEPRWLDVRVQHWMKSESRQPGDLDRNGMVNSADLALLTKDWLKYVKPPVVNIIVPQNDEVFAMQPADIEIEAVAEAVIGVVVKVEFFVSDTKIDEDNDASNGWAASFRHNAIGIYNLTATATDSRGITATSSPVKINILPP